MNRILLITPYAPSNIGAAMKFTKKTIEQLSSFCFVDVIYFRAEEEPLFCPKNKKINVLKVLDVGKKDRLLSILQKPLLFPIFSVRYRRDLIRWLKKYTGQVRYDLVFLDHSQTFIYGKIFPHTSKVLMSHDVIYQRVNRRFGRLMTYWCTITERGMLHQPNSYIFSFSTKDQNLILNQYGLDSYVTNGLVDDLIYSTFPIKITSDFVFFGQWVRKDNTDGLEWFFDNVYPKIKKEYKFKIIGRGLPPMIIDRIEKYENVEYLGFVDNPYQIIANARALLSPLFSGAGVKFKVLDSMACGTPVIGNEISFEGIPGEYSDFMIMCNTIDDYVRSIENVNTNIDLRQSFQKKFLKKYVKSQLIEFIRYKIQTICE